MNEIFAINIGAPVHDFSLCPNQGDLLCVTAPQAGIAVWTWDQRPPFIRQRITWETGRCDGGRPLDPSAALESRNGMLVNRAIFANFDFAGSVFVTIGPDSAIEVYDSRTLQRLQRFGEPGQFSSAAFDPSGQFILASGCIAVVDERRGLYEGRAVLFDWRNGRKVSDINGYLGAPVFHPAGTVVIGRINQQDGTETRFLSVDPRSPMQWFDLSPISAGPVTLQPRAAAFAGNGGNFPV